jgi:hypothetical protein
MEISLVFPQSISIPDIWITIFIIALLAFIGKRLIDSIIIVEDYNPP